MSDHGSSCGCCNPPAGADTSAIRERMRQVYGPEELPGRRQFLKALAGVGAAGVLAGCTTSDGATNTTADPTETTAESPGTTATATEDGVETLSGTLVVGEEMSVTEGTVRIEDGEIVSITEDTTLRGTYGDGDGFDIDAGGTLAYGDYNIKLGDNEEPIVIHYESEHPILPLDMPVAFNCDLFHEEWGEGQVRGTTNVPGGGIRNVLTFPPSL